MLPAAQDEAPQNSKAFGSHRTPEAFFITAPDLCMSDDGAAQKTTAPKARSPSPHFTREEKKMNENNRLRLAMQKSGRLSDDSQDLLERCGLKVRFHSQRLLAVAENMPVEILRVRDDDIPGLVMDGVVDLGIIGENVLEETVLARRSQGEEPKFHMLKRFDFGGCRLSVAIPTDETWGGLESLNGRRIATSYPQLLKRCFDERGLTFKPCLLTGSVEVEVVYRSKACLIAKAEPFDNEKAALVERLLVRMQGVARARECKYIMLHAPKAKLAEITKLLPGAEHPTILPLAGSTDHVALHMVSRESLFWETMEGLKALGASSILVLPIEKMME